MLPGGCSLVVPGLLLGMDQSAKVSLCGEDLGILLQTTYLFYYMILLVLKA